MVKQLGKHAGRLAAEALGLDPNMVRRIVVDYAPDGAVVAHVEMFVDERIIAVTQTLAGVTVERESRAGSTETEIAQARILSRLRSLAWECTGPDSDGGRWDVGAIQPSEILSILDGE